MKEILDRLKDPLIITQLIGIIGGLIIFFVPESAEAGVAAVNAALIAVVNTLSGKNRP